MPREGLPIDCTRTFSFTEACRRADLRAKRSSSQVFVVPAGDGEYAVADEEDLDTWWIGSSVVAAFDAGGPCWD